MKHQGPGPFDRPMRPDRVDLIRQTAEAIAKGEIGKVFAREAETFEGYIELIAWNIFGALNDTWPDTMVSEVLAGVAEAEPVCRAEY